MDRLMPLGQVGYQSDRAVSKKRWLPATSASVASVSGSQNVIIDRDPLGLYERIFECLYVVEVKLAIEIPRGDALTIL